VQDLIDGFQSIVLGPQPLDPSHQALKGNLMFDFTKAGCEHHLPPSRKRLRQGTLFVRASFLNDTFSRDLQPYQADAAECLRKLV